MVRFVYTNDILISLILIQIYIIYQPTKVCSERLNNFMTNRAPCCVNDECDILCCIQRGNCPYSKKAKRSTLFSFSKDAYCYNADSQQDIRLWENRAPGAVGNDPCKDIPFMRVFWPTKSVRRTDIGMLIFPGGGYGRLTNFREQAPVAEYFANKLGMYNKAVLFEY